MRCSCVNFRVLVYIMRTSSVMDGNRARRSATVEGLQAAITGEHCLRFAEFDGLASLSRGRFRLTRLMTSS